MRKLSCSGHFGLPATDVQVSRVAMNGKQCVTLSAVSWLLVDSFHPDALSGTGQ